MVMFLQEAASSPWLDPRVLIVAGPLAVGLIAWFLRGEFQSKANTTRQQEHEEADERRHAEVVAYVDEVREEHRELKKSFYLHSDDAKRHHNPEYFEEFRKGLETRFTHIDTSLNDILRKLDGRGPSGAVRKTNG